jgi:hypothetical protein
MKKYFLLIVLVLLLTACNETPVPTPNPAEVALTLLADKVNAEATQAVVNMRFTATAQMFGITATQQQIYLQATATEQARVDIAATAAQTRRDAQATAEQKRLDIQATQQRIDADATQEQARLDVIATQQAGSTATAGVMTMTAIPPAATLTQIANEQNIILANNQVQLSNLQVEQQSQKNTPEWVIPYLLLFGLVAGVLWYVKSQSRVREVKNEDGDVELLIIDHTRAIRPRLLAGPVLDLNGEVSMPMLTAPSEQAKVTERAQAVEAIKNMPTSTTPQAAQTFNKYFGTQQQDLPFEIIDAEETPPAGLLDGETLKSLNKDWKEAKDGG